MKKHTYLVVMLALVSLSLYICLSSCGSNPSSSNTPTDIPRITKGPYLLYTGSTESMTIMWQLSKTVSDCVIEWGSSTSYGSSVITTENSSTTEYHQYSYTITGLSPDEKVYYKMSTPLGTYESFFYAPSAANKDPFIFYAYGDTRGFPARHDQLLSLILADSDSRNQGTFLLHTGDFAAAGLEESNLNSEFFYRDRTATLSLESRIPIIYCIGNHDAYSSSKNWEYTSNAGRLLRKFWPYTFNTSPGRCYYSFEFGPVFVCILDQYTKTDYATPPDDAVQYSWATQEIKASTKKWKVVLMHEPAWSAKVTPYPSDSHGNHPEIQQYYHPIFRANTVEVVVEGHNHFYSRCVTNEVNYLTSGGGGINLHVPELGAQYLITAESVNEFLKFSITGNVMTVEAIDYTGTIFDSFIVVSP